MATGSVVLCFLHMILPIAIFYINLGNAEFIIPDCETLKSCKLDKIYQVGDSMADTGNLIREFPLGASTYFSKLPYGQDFYTHQPSGRCSNGLLMIDYIASAAGLAFVNPYKDVGANFTHGANFAVAGSTAMPSQVLLARNISNPLTNSSLDVQLRWVSNHFDSICDTYKDCAKKLKSALFLVGEIGGNDYNYAFGIGKSVEEVKFMVPEVVQAIKNAAKRVIQQYGAVRLVIPGDYPTGCFPVILTAYRTGNASAYDEYYCLKDHNEFSAYHNHHLQQAIKELKQEFPNTIIVYGDYYKAFLWLLQRARHLGFDEQSALKACCGFGGDYNYDSKNHCGTPRATVCEDPNVRISWDGVHLTQATYKIMASWLLDSIVPQLQCSDLSSTAI